MTIHSNMKIIDKDATKILKTPSLPPAALKVTKDHHWKY